MPSKDVATLVEMEIRFVVYPHDGEVDIFDAISLIKSKMRSLKLPKRVRAFPFRGRSRVLTEKTIAKVL